MRILVVSDIHANFVAFEAVLKDAGSFDTVWCLGDVVGYGPQPNECVEQLRELHPVCLAGNHDLAVTGQIALWDFTKDAQEVIFWTRHWLTQENMEWLTTLSSTPQVEHGITIVHASLRDPVWEYITNASLVKDNIQFAQTPICLHGHTHLATLFRKKWDEYRILEEYPRLNTPIKLIPDQMFINPGSVGQPRDEDPRAAYALIDTDEMTYTQKRVLYDVTTVQGLMKQAKFSNRLIRRLRFGQ
ncbi:MAG TPA: metallophosphoesterase family protein [Anaerolineales bacterium]|nr:metallophosphoesterase family protein [Anaerolineales bacterium]